MRDKYKTNAFLVLYFIGAFLVVWFMFANDFENALNKHEPTTTVYPIPRVSIIPEQADILMSLPGDNKAYMLK